jgi:hypothetical protein
MADGKKDSVKDNTQAQGKAAPAMAAASDNSAAFNKFMTEFLNEVALQNGASAISEHGMRGFGLGFYAAEEEIMVVMEAGNIHVIEDEIIGVMDAENPFMIEEERTVPMPAPRKPKRFKLVSPLRLIRSGNMADRSVNRKAKKHMARKHGRSDGMVLNLDEIVPEEGADMEKGNGKRKSRYYAFRLRRLGHNGRRLRFRADDDGWVTVMKGSKRDAEREITMPVYSATYNGKGINHRTNARSMARQRNNVAQYDRELRRKIDRRTAQRALEMANRRIKIERQKRAGAKRAKEAFDRLAREDTSAQAEDKRREIAALR